MFIDTMLNNQYRDFVSQEFNHKEIEYCFQNWILKDMINWDKLSNYDSKITIEFYGHGNPYRIKNSKQVGGEYNLPYPKTINDFISDCLRCSVDLSWNDNIVQSMNRTVFMKQSDIKDYNKNLLTSIEKK